jgi:hypothetical protein
MPSETKSTLSKARHDERAKLFPPRARARFSPVPELSRWFVRGASRGPNGG